MDQLHDRVDALASQLHTLHQQTRAVERRLRWWRRLACGLVGLGLLSWGLQAGKAVDAQSGTLADRRAALQDTLAALEHTLRHVTVVTTQEGLDEVTITGANLRIVNGLGATGTTNGLGNLIVGYNEGRPPDLGPDTRTGSHNVVVGTGNNFSSSGGLVVGILNEISGEFASVSGGSRNTASGEASSVSGGLNNVAAARGSSISGGTMNRTLPEPGVEFEASSISGGSNNLARGIGTSISGGFGNHTHGGAAEVGNYSSVSGGRGNFADGDFSSVCGGFENVAAGNSSSVSGGTGISENAEFGWAAGSFGGAISGRFRSP
jgi:hypothetical protein